MALARLRRRILGRHSVRARIALAFAALFLVTVAAFVAAIYTVVDHSFPAPATRPGSAPTGLANTCKLAEAIPGRPKLRPALLAQCQYFFGAFSQQIVRAHV